MPCCLKSIKISSNEIEVQISKEKMVSLFSFLQNHTWTQFKVLSDIITIDYPSRSDRFDIVYQLLSLRYNVRLNILVTTDELKPLSSISSLYEGAVWYEREVWDLYGIFFEGHPDLRRILTDYSFEGHPLRKDFPLTGYFELFYDDVKKRIVYEPVSLVQEYRYFTFTNPWVE